MCPLALYSDRGNKKKQAFDIVFWSFIYAAVPFFFLDKAYGVLQMFTFISIPVLLLYNGERGGRKSGKLPEGTGEALAPATKVSPLVKWSFYIYYPAHLVVVGIIRVFLYGWDKPLIFG